MSATRASSLTDIIPRRSAGYVWDGKTYSNGEMLHPSGAFAAGFLISNVLDLAMWDAALYTDRPLKQSSLQQIGRPPYSTTGSRTVMDLAGSAPARTGIG
jgi:hypothetical protein